jgi:hypothetical protein
MTRHKNMRAEETAAHKHKSSTEIASPFMNVYLLMVLEAA